MLLGSTCHQKPHPLGSPSSRPLMYQGVHIAQQEDIGKKLERSEITACGEVFRYTGLESGFVKSLDWGRTLLIVFCHIYD